MCLIQVALIHSEGILAGEMKRSSHPFTCLMPLIQVALLHSKHILTGEMKRSSPRLLPPSHVSDPGGADPQ